MSHIGDAFAVADAAEARSFMQSQARCVLGEDARLDRPYPGPNGLAHESGKQGGADAAAVSAIGDVDGMFHDASVDLSGRYAGSGDPAENGTSGVGCDEPADVELSFVEVIPGWGVALERGVSCGDAFAVDRFHLGPVVPPHGPDGRAGHGRRVWDAASRVSATTR